MSRGWLRVPGHQRLAHLIEEGQPLTRRLLPPALQGVDYTVGTTWRTVCGRYLVTRWRTDLGTDWPYGNPRWIDPLELRREKPRGWCLRCAYHAALDALVLPERDFRSFSLSVLRAGGGPWRPPWEG